MHIIARNSTFEGNLPVIRHKSTEPHTMHIWIRCKTKDESYGYYLKLEQLKLLTNYRLLPYDLGFGLRIGTGGAVISGLRPSDVTQLAKLMIRAYYEEINSDLRRQTKRFIKNIKKRTLT